MSMNVSDFLAKLKDIEANYKTVYMWGSIGALVTAGSVASRAAQYPDWYTEAKKTYLNTLASRGYFGFDCIGIIKSILWGWNGDESAPHGGAKYASGGVPDIDANYMIKVCKDVSTDFKSIVPGEAVWMQGHIGVYIGNGKVIECTPSWSGGVQITACLNIGAIPGLNGRRWTSRGKIPYVIYNVEEEEMTQAEFNKFMDTYLAERAKLPVSPSLSVEFAEAKKLGTTDGTRPRDFATREEVAVMVRRVTKV